jgi:hypothetical protein
MSGSDFGNKHPGTLVDALWLDEVAGYGVGDSFDTCPRAKFGARIVHGKMDSSFAHSEPG